MSHSVLDTKDRRSFEHARQKRLHPIDRQASANANPWKGKRFVGNSLKQQWRGLPQSGTRCLPPLNTDDIDTDVEGTYHVWGDYCPCCVAEAEAASLAASTTPPPMQFDIGALVRPARVRKGIAGDYELVPRPRQVMIVDDQAESSGHHATVSEGSSSDSDDLLDWELLDELGRKPVARRSYAAVTSL
ncbi:hypothetical protein DL93DRAFT_2072684 [Clavulina sp. PMI_390]|nr:hypothetical protein DL93DRAFT_2072684 [Clavulina sp. PMI_390]